MKNRLIGRGMFLIVLVFFGLVFTGCPTDAKTDDEPVTQSNPPTDTVDPAFWFNEIYFSLIERVGEILSDNYSGETGDEMGQIANCQYVIDAINAKWGTNYTPASGTALLAANCEYLLKAIDRANNNTTAYGTSVKATQQLVDTNAVNQAVNTLWVPGSKFVAVTNGNKAAYSTDGINWTEITLPSNENWISVTYGNGKFVAIAESNKVAYSTDGMNWTEVILPYISLCNITCGKGKFVIIAFNKALYSTNGINWSETAMPSNLYWNSVTYGNDKFVAITSSANSNKAAYSTDGINWTGTALPGILYWRNVIYGNGKFVAISSNGNNKAAYSTDGINWTETTLSSNVSWQDIAYGNGKFVAVAWSNKAAYSTNGINWTEITLPSNENWISVTYGNGKFVAVAYKSNKTQKEDQFIHPHLNCKYWYWSVHCLPRLPAPQAKSLHPASV